MVFQPRITNLIGERVSFVFREGNRVRMGVIEQRSCTKPNGHIQPQKLRPTRIGTSKTTPRARKGKIPAEPKIMMESKTPIPVPAGLPCGMTKGKGINPKIGISHPIPANGEN